jgi:very-short-patch-repair endonuclease
MGDYTDNSRCCRICGHVIGKKAFGSHLKRKHCIDFKNYVLEFKDDFDNLRSCVICCALCFSTGKDATCSRQCLTKLRGMWTGDKSPRKGATVSEESRRKMGELYKDRLANGQVHGRKGKTFSAESRKKMSESAKRNASRYDYVNPMQGKTHSAESIKKIFSHRKMNKLEKLVADVLDANQIQYTFQFFINKGGTCKSYDFKLKDSNLIIEIDGDFWHGNCSSKVKFDNYEEVQKNDQLKSSLAAENGYKLIRLWESDIKKDSSIIITSINSAL